jgi:hypothetical protein
MLQLRPADAPRASSCAGQSAYSEVAIESGGGSEIRGERPWTQPRFRPSGPNSALKNWADRNVCPAQSVFSRKKRRADIPVCRIRRILQQGASDRQASGLKEAEVVGLGAASPASDRRRLDESRRPARAAVRRSVRSMKRLGRAKCHDQVSSASSFVAAWRLRPAKCADRSALPANPV